MMADDEARRDSQTAEPNANDFFPFFFFFERRADTSV